MKVALLLFIAASLAAAARAKAVEAPLHLISLEDLTEEDRRHLEALNEEATRSKRSGGSGGASGDLFAQIASAIGQTIKKKITQVARSSASASAHFSGGLSGGGHGDGASTPHKDDFDWWALKKSILNTLLQAVKAIKGGVIAINGQLIKGSGYLISAKGRLLASKGDSITELGKKIASSALLSPSSHSAVHAEVAAHPPISSYGPPPTEYGVPSAYYPAEHGVGYEPQKFSAHYDDSLAHGSEAGIVILKKIPKKSKQKGDETVPEFKPLGNDDLSFKNVVGKFFHASTSLQPDGPTAPDSDDRPETPASSFPDVLENKKPNTFEEVNFETHPELYQKPDSLLANASAPDLLGGYYEPPSLDSLPSIETFPPYPGKLPAEFLAAHQLQAFDGGFRLSPPANPFSVGFDPRARPFAPPPPKKTRRAPQKPALNAVRSVTYELTRNGPVKV